MLTKNAVQLNRKANQCRVMSANYTTGVIRVKSPSGNTYTVNLLNGIGCNCDWGRRGGVGCSHEMAARKNWEANQNGRKVSFQVGNEREVAHQQHKATRAVAIKGDDALTMVLRDRDPLHGVVRFCKSWDLEAVDLYREGSLPEKVGLDRYDALVTQARKQGWSERGLYWWRE